MGLALPFHSSIFDDIMMTSSGLRENSIFLLLLLVPYLWKTEPHMKLKCCKQHKHDNYYYQQNQVEQCDCQPLKVRKVSRIISLMLGKLQTLLYHKSDT